MGVGAVASTRIRIALRMFTPIERFRIRRRRESRTRYRGSAYRVKGLARASMGQRKLGLRLEREWQATCAYDLLCQQPACKLRALYLALLFTKLSPVRKLLGIYFAGWHNTHADSANRF